MTTHLPSLLENLRRWRGFDVAEVAAAKECRMTRWFLEEKLDSAVVGVSGGVDSAVILAFLQRLKAAGILRRVIAMLLPIPSSGATNQETATRRGRLVAESLEAEIWECPLDEAHAAIIATIERASRLKFDSWSEGQALSIVRTPALYGAAALLQSHGFRSIVVGTTNRDEGSYLGFFGKASDAMVDLQPISDLHKSEVRSFAYHFGIPAEIINAIPSGDVHDGRCDEEMIGATYDEIEAYLRLRELGRPLSFLNSQTIAAIEMQHGRNRHKYRVGNSARHLDVMPRAVPGGWENEPLSPRHERRPPKGVLPGEWDLPAIVLDPIEELPKDWQLPTSGFAVEVQTVLTADDCGRIRTAMHQCSCGERVGMSGTRGSHGSGSIRMTSWSPEFAESLWLRVAPVIPSVRFLNEYSFTDAYGTSERVAHRSWRVVGLSPILRFMQYEPGGGHCAHYDAGFDYADGRRTLLSVLFYLTDAIESGATRFIHDGQENMRTVERDFSDWTQQANKNEVLAIVYPRAGNAVVFDHRLCHDAECWNGLGPRMLIRADVVYEAIPDGRV